MRSMRGGSAFRHRTGPGSRKVKKELQRVQDLFSRLYRREFGEPLPEQVAKLVLHLGNSNDGERTNALRLLEQALKRSELKLSDIANRLAM